MANKFTHFDGYYTGRSAVILEKGSKRGYKVVFSTKSSGRKTIKDNITSKTEAMRIARTNIK